MNLPIYQIDAFSREVFRGNPAAVMPLPGWLPDETLQALAQENRLSETAFLVPLPDSDEADFHIRWFTPTTEVPLCGHATLASAWVVFHRQQWPRADVRFHSHSGLLAVHREADGWLTLDFPALKAEPVPTPVQLRQALPAAPETAFYVPADTNYMLVLENEAEVRAARPDLRPLAALGNQGLIITAAGRDCDFVSRYFAPGAGIDEDPVTGSIHCVLAPYWGKRLGKTQTEARQLSARGGVLRCHWRGDRVAISGQAAFYMEGSVSLPAG